VGIKVVLCKVNCRVGEVTWERLRGLHAREDTIGGTPINLSRLDTISSQQKKSVSILNPPMDGTANSNRTRAQSSYGAPAGWDDSTLQSNTPPLRMRRKSGGSADAGIGTDTGKYTTTTTGTGKFVDPVIVRKKERGGVTSPRTPIGGRGRTVGELAAFFDGEKWFVQGDQWFSKEFCPVIVYVIVLSIY